MKKYKDLVNSLEMLFSVKECKERGGGYKMTENICKSSIGAMRTTFGSFSQLFVSFIYAFAIMYDIGLYFVAGGGVHISLG